MLRDRASQTDYASLYHLGAITRGEFRKCLGEKCWRQKRSRSRVAGDRKSVNASLAPTYEIQLDLPCTTSYIQPGNPISVLKLKEARERRLRLNGAMPSLKTLETTMRVRNSRKLYGKLRIGDICFLKIAFRPPDRTITSEQRQRQQRSIYQIYSHNRYLLGGSVSIGWGRICPRKKPSAVHICRCLARHSPTVFGLLPPLVKIRYYQRAPREVTEMPIENAKKKSFHRLQ